MGERSLALAPAANSVLIKITQGPHAGESFTITKQTFAIGRNADNDIVLPNDSKISRNHVSLSRKGNVYIVENLSMRNPLQQDQQTKGTIELHPGSKFQIGESELELTWEHPIAPKPAAPKPTTSNQASVAANPVAISNKTPGSVNPQASHIQTPGSANAPVLNKPPFNPNNRTPQNHNVQPPSANNLANARPASNFPAQSGNKKISVSVNQNYEHLNNNYPKKKKPKAKSNNSFFIFIIIIIGALVLFMIPSKDTAKKAKKSKLRSSEEIQKALETSKISVETYQKEKRIQEDGSIDKQYQSSQSYYIRGFRDYRQGQYARAIQAFQAALSFDPNHVLSRKYLNSSLKKLDELVQFNLNQGRRYREKNNFRLCKSAFQQVMVIKKDPNAKIYKEAKQLFDECETLLKGRY